MFITQILVCESVLPCFRTLFNQIPLFRSIKIHNKAFLYIIYALANRCIYTLRLIVRQLHFNGHPGGHVDLLFLGPAPEVVRKAELSAVGSVLVK